MDVIGVVDGELLVMCGVDAACWGKIDVARLVRWTTRIGDPRW